MSPQSDAVSLHYQHYLMNHYSSPALTLNDMMNDNMPELQGLLGESGVSIELSTEAVNCLVIPDVISMCCYIARYVPQCQVPAL